MFHLRRPKETTEHAPSFYAATATRRTDYPALAEDISVDVAVVGGGFTGVNTALELSERGFSVALLEGNRIGWGASGRNGGQIIGGIGHDPERFIKTIGASGVQTIYQMGMEARDIIAERIERYEIACDLKWGYCDVALKARHMKQFAQWRDLQKRIGNPHSYTLLTAEELRQFVGSERYCGGLYNIANGHIHPLNLCLGEAAAAAQQGARIFEQSRVVAIEQGSRPRVVTDGGSVTAASVVLAGNAYMEGLVPRLASRILPACSSMVATVPLAEDLARAIVPGDVAACDPRTALDYFRLSADKRLLFGGLANYTGLEPKDVRGVLRRKMEWVFPQLRAVPIEYSWSGYIGIGLNRMPQLGRLADNVFYIQAYSGHGVAPTHIMARITAEMIAGAPERFDVMARISHRSFPGGKLFRRPALAVGMAYFKARDLV